MGLRKFAAGHACIYSLLKNPQSREKCAFFSQHATPHMVQKTNLRTNADLPNIWNTGLLVISPSTTAFNYILGSLRSDTKLKADFAEQSLILEDFHECWVPLPYTYNALKTLRWRLVYSKTWRDECVKYIYYILTPKPLEDIDAEGKSVSKEPTD
ncbi:hypothetical protein HI914_01168 [Erysiphe necator]|nr:hypothetical protein HI914_01168 [Erysiphe necator]